MSKKTGRVTIADVAQKADVSAMTVSRVINNKADISDKTRQHVLKVMDEVGYRPNRIARSLASDKSYKIGIVIPSISSAFFAEILEGAQLTLWEADYNLLLCNTGRNPQREQDVLHLLEEDRVDGVIIFSAFSACDDLTQLLSQQPASVAFSTDVDEQVCGRIVIDELVGMRLAVNHLVANGRSCLGYVGIGSATHTGRERQRCFDVAMVEADLLPNDDYKILSDANDWERSFHVTQSLLEKHPEIDGLMCYNDYIASGALQACASLGKRVPEDIAVIGIDDIVLASVVSPQLTTLRYEISNQAVGSMAADMLLKRIQGDLTRKRVTLKHELVIRASAP